MLVFLSEAANLIAIGGEKEQSLQEKTEVILQKEQEILQLKKGEESAKAGPFHLFLPGPLPGGGPVTALTSPLPGLGHDSALLQMRQLQSELEALRGLRAEQSEAADEREDLLRLRSQEQGVVLSVREPHVSPA